MMYSQQQALQILGLDQSTFVYWMRVVPRVKRLKGRGCHITQADMLALGVLKAATHTLGCQISSLGTAISIIFDVMASASIADLGPRAIIIENAHARLEKLPMVVSGPSPAVIIPLRPIIDAVTLADDQLLPLERLMVRRP